MLNKATIYVGDVLAGIKHIPDNSIQCCVTSPPYWGLRDYGHADQLGLEPTVDEYVQNMVAVFSEVKRILTDDGVLWLNLGDSYFSSSRTLGRNEAKDENNDFYQARNKKFQPHETKSMKVASSDLKPKDLVGVPWRVAFALQSDGWYLRQDIIWHKPNPMPESVTDRCTKSHEYVFLLTKSQKYFFNTSAIAEPSQSAGRVSTFNSKKNTAAARAMNRKPSGNEIPGTLYEIKDMRNKRSVWTINNKGVAEAHFAVMPEELAELCILASTKEEDFTFDPFTGSGTVGAVSFRHSRNFKGTELNPEYASIAERRIQDENQLFGEVETIIVQ